jgi:2-haloacid dehalogenase
MRSVRQAVSVMLHSLGSDLMAQRWATFDCYGTLIDWDAGISTQLARSFPGTDPAPLLEIFHAIEPLVQRGRALPYREVLTRSLRAIAAVEGMEPVGSDSALADSLPTWTAFPEVQGSLRLLRERGWKLGILSNTDPDLLAASIANIDVEIDLRITAADAGSYKPAHGHWQEFYRETDADPTTHLHVAASAFHDLAPCAELGIPAVWINRLGEESAEARAAELLDLAWLPDTLDLLRPA